MLKVGPGGLLLRNSGGTRLIDDCGEITPVCGVQCGGVLDSVVVTVAGAFDCNGSFSVQNPFSLQVTESGYSGNMNGVFAGALVSQQVLPTGLNAEYECPPIGIQFTHAAGGLSPCTFSYERRIHYRIFVQMLRQTTPGPLRITSVSVSMVYYDRRITTGPQFECGGNTDTGWVYRGFFGDVGFRNCPSGEPFVFNNSGGPVNPCFNANDPQGFWGYGPKGGGTSTIAVTCPPYVPPPPNFAPESNAQPDQGDNELGIPLPQIREFVETHCEDCQHSGLGDATVVWPDGAPKCALLRNCSPCLTTHLAHGRPLPDGCPARAQEAP